MQFIDSLKVVARRSTGVYLEARISGERLAYALSIAEASNLSGALIALTAATTADYYSITETLTLLYDPEKKLYLETVLDGAVVFLPLDEKRAKQIAADLEYAATAVEFEHRLTLRMQ